MSDPFNAMSIDFISNPYTDDGINKQTTLHNYLGYNPTQQSKSEKFHNYMTYKPAYFVYSGNDYDLPNNVINNQPAINPRFEFKTYSLPKSQLTASEIRNYKDVLNPKGANETEFKAHELYGYIESLT